MDTRTSEQRRRIMQAVKSRDTGPEMIVRRLLHRMGYRYRLHRKDLPGKPDVALVSRRKAIFVHGCFWHGHGCPKGRLPKSRLDYWQPPDEVRARLQVLGPAHSSGGEAHQSRTGLVPGRDAQGGEGEGAGVQAGGPLGPRPERRGGSHLRGGRREGDGDPLADLEEPIPHGTTAVGSSSGTATRPRPRSASSSPAWRPDYAAHLSRKPGPVHPLLREEPRPARPCQRSRRGGDEPCARRHESATRRRAISWATPRVGRLESSVTGSIVWDPLIGVLGRRYPQMKAIGLNWR